MTTYKLNGTAIGLERDRPDLTDPEAVTRWIARQAGADVDEVRRTRLAAMEARTATGDPELDAVRARVLDALRRPSAPRTTTATADTAATRTAPTGTITTTTTTNPVRDAQVRRAGRYGG